MRKAKNEPEAQPEKPARSGGFSERHLPKLEEPSKEKAEEKKPEEDES
jgi:hypothetical protein